MFILYMNSIEILIEKKIETVSPNESMNYIPNLKRKISSKSDEY